MTGMMMGMNVANEMMKNMNQNQSEQPNQTQASQNNAPSMKNSENKQNAPNFCPNCGEKTGGANFCPQFEQKLAPPVFSPQRKNRRCQLLFELWTEARIEYSSRHDEQLVVKIIRQALRF